MKRFKLYTVLLLISLYQFSRSQILTILNQTNPSCISGGSITFTISGGSSPYYVHMDNPMCIFPSPKVYSTSSNTMSISGIQPCSGNYTFTVFDSGNTMMDTLSHFFSFPNNCMGLFAVNGALTCNIDCASTATVMNVTSSLPTSYTWSPGGMTTAIVNNLCAGIYTIVGVDSLGNSGLSQLVILPSSVACVGISEPEIPEPISIFPNPTSREIHLKIRNYGNEIVEIWNTFGHVVYRNLYSETVDVSGLTTGIYFIKCGSVTSKFIKDD